MAQIVKVRTEDTGWGDGSHEHITDVELSNGSQQARSSVISNIRYGLESYWTFGGGLVADVVVRGCPHCSNSDYITTLPDTTTRNNLLELPRF